MLCTAPEPRRSSRAWAWQRHLTMNPALPPPGSAAADKLTRPEADPREQVLIRSPPYGEPHWRVCRVLAAICWGGFWCAASPCSCPSLVWLPAVPCSCCLTFPGLSVSIDVDAGLARGLQSTRRTLRRWEGWWAGAASAVADLAANQPSPHSPCRLRGGHCQPAVQHAGGPTVHGAAGGEAASACAGGGGQRGGGGVGSEG